MKFHLHKLVVLFLLFLIYNGNAQSQITAFPGAEGAGKNTTGGRGTASAASKVFAVTSLADDGSAGTLRWALTQAATYRTIIFRVSGTIHLSAPLKFNKANTTIAGQTAPGEGICIADYPVSVTASNVIVRYIRFRMGDKNQNLGEINGSGNDDAFDGTGINKIMIDHCTMSWSDDEACSFYRGDSITLQWNMISEPLNYSYHFETGDTGYEHHGYGGIWGGQHASFYHNLLAHCQGRSPRFDGSRNLGNGSTPGLENADFVNNVIYDWGSYNVNGGEGGNYNIVNNYYKYGPSTSHSSTSGVKITQEIIYAFDQASPALPYGKYYLSGNYVDAASAVTADNWKGAAFGGGTLADTAQSKVTVPFNIVPMPTQAPDDAYNSVLQNSGCSLPNRDTLDGRIINDVINRTGRIIDVQGGYPHGTPYAQTVNAWPSLLSTTPPVTTNADNIPDTWLAQRGLTGMAVSGAGGYHSNGYTHLENFLNGDLIVAPGTLNTCVTAKQINSVNSAGWINAKDSLYSYYASSQYLISTDTNNVVASILDNGNYGSLTVSYYTTDVTRYDAANVPYLNRNITVTPNDPSAISGEVTVRIYFTGTEFNALMAADNTIHSINDLVILKTSDNSCITTLSGTPEIITPSSSGTYGTYQTGYYLEFNTTSFSTFFVESKFTSVVPLRLLAFQAIAGKAQVQTSWLSQQEINAKYFIVERSIDGKNFTAIGHVDANNSSGTNNYEFTDTSPLDGISYYRLKMIDNNGSFIYSKIISVNITGDEMLSVNPDPALNNIIVSFKNVTSLAKLHIISSDGRIVMKKAINAGAVHLNLSVSFLPKGVYEVILIDKGLTKTARFIKQ